MAEGFLSENRPIPSLASTPGFFQGNLITLQGVTFDIWFRGLGNHRP